MKPLTSERLNQLIGTCRTKCNALAPEDLAKLDKDMAITFSEHFDFQNLQASYHAQGYLTPDAAQIVYVALGEGYSSPANNGGWSQGTDTATKVIITQLMGELLHILLKRRGVTARA